MLVSPFFATFAETHKVSYASIRSFLYQFRGLNDYLCVLRNGQGVAGLFNSSAAAPLIISHEVISNDKCITFGGFDLSFVSMWKKDEPMTFSEGLHTMIVCVFTEKQM